MPRWSGVAGALLLAGCASTSPGGRPPGGPPELHALLLNGGGTARTNYFSHLIHLGVMYETLGKAGVTPRQIDVLSADGASPTPDVAIVRAAPGPDAWLLDGTQLERPLGRPVRYVSTHSPRLSLQPATAPDLNRWFGQAADELRAGDTLLLFVTDHGEKGKTPQQNRITLWNRDSITVRELGRQLDRLPDGVRVVTVMTQCYSGGFSELALSPTLTGRPPGSTCGYFSTTADRMAYGCYPDADIEHDGYAIRFAQGLARTSSLGEAHAEALLTDRTPDVPLRSSDLYLARIVERAAIARRTTAEHLVSELAVAALAGTSPAARATAALAEQVSVSFAVPLPREPGDLQAMNTRLETLGDKLRANAEIWENAVYDLAQANLDQFLTEHPATAQWLVPRELDRLGLERLKRQQGAAVSELAAFTRRHPARLERLEQGHRRLGAVRASRARSETRMAAGLRLRALLTSLVGLHLLETEGTAAQRQELAALAACESVRLPRPGAASGPPPQPRAFPSIDSDERVMTAFAPASLGTVLADLPAAEQAAGRLPAGALRIATVKPGSPAAAARLAAGDVLLGEVGAPAGERGGLRLQLALGQNRVRQLEVERAGKRLVVEVRPDRGGGGGAGRELPAAWRTALRTLTPLRGAVGSTLEARKPVLLFFWATWCTFCKHAVPELMALERERGISVLSITDEKSLTIEGFLAGWKGPFPQLVALDPDRRANEAFQVDGLPTFVLVDEHGRVRMTSMGYRPETGLPIDGWSFAVEGGVGPVRASD